MKRRAAMLIVSVLVFFCCTTASSAEDFLDTLAGRTWHYLTSATTNHLPWSWKSDFVPGGDYCNPAEMGYYMLCNIAAYEIDSLTWPQAAAEIESTLNHLEAWQKGTYPVPNGSNAYDDSLFYQWYWISWNPPVVGDSSNQVVPSIDNALLAASLITIMEYADSNSAVSIRDKCDSILGRLNFLAWYDQTTHRFRHGAYRNPQGGSVWDIYSNENRIINFVARALGQLTEEEFWESLDSIDSCLPDSYDTIRVKRPNWDGSYFTYTVPALFIKEMETCYGDSTIDPVTRAQIEYAEDSSYVAWGISDAFWGPNPNSERYMELGAPPRCSGNSEDNPDSGIVAPHVSALALITSRDSLAIANLQTLADTFSFPGLYDASRGFFDSVNLKDSVASSRFSALAQAYIFLSIMNYKQRLAWNYFHRNPGVDTAYADLLEWLGCPSHPGVHESDLRTRANKQREFRLSVNTPNPFSQLTTISFFIPQKSRVQLNIYNLSGQLMRTLIDELRESGHYKVQWNARNDDGDEVGSGVYFWCLKAGTFTATRKMTLLR